MSTQPYDPQHVAFLASEIRQIETRTEPARDRLEQVGDAKLPGLKRLRASLKREQAKAAQP